VTPILRAEGLTKTFGQVVAVEDFSLSIAPGEIFGLVGPDGAGKSTTLRLLCGIMVPDRGCVMVAGHDLVNAKAAASQVGYVPQRFALSPMLTVAENAAFTAEIYGVPPAVQAERIAVLLEFTGLAPFARRRAGQLSGGMQRKLALVCALLHRPPLLLLDEPTSGVDPVSRQHFWELLHRLACEGIALVVSTTYLEEAERCHRVGILYRGRMMLCDTPEALRARRRARVVELWCDEIVKARQVIEKMPEVQAVYLTGDRLRVFLPLDAPSEEEFLRRAEAAGAGIRGAVRGSPTVEDAFLYFLREQQYAPAGGSAVAALREREK